MESIDTSYQPLDGQSPILVAENLKKSYRSRQALKGLSFSLKPGRVLGFLGPNGAGKTTSIRILTTILKPDSGDFWVGGVSSEFPQRIRQKIGVLPESLGFPKQISGIEYLTYFGQLYGLSPNQARRNSRALLEEVGMQQRAKSVIGSYSRGMRQRLGIARALVNKPVVVFLDEPTLGLDPQGQQELLALVQRIAQERNAGVILCSHQLSDIEPICDDVIILNEGQVIVMGPVSEVINRTKQNALRVQVSPSAVDDAKRVLETLPFVLFVSIARKERGLLRIELAEKTAENIFEDQYINNKILEALIRSECPILRFEAEGSRLQDAFFKLTTEVLDEQHKDI